MKAERQLRVNVGLFGCTGAKTFEIGLTAKQEAIIANLAAKGSKVPNLRRSSYATKV